MMLTAVLVCSLAITPDLRLPTRNGFQASSQDVDGKSLLPEACRSGPVGRSCACHRLRGVSQRAAEHHSRAIERLAVASLFPVGLVQRVQVRMRILALPPHRGPVKSQEVQ